MLHTDAIRAVEIHYHPDDIDDNHVVRIPGRQ
jgi:hypothetical protein